MLHFRNPANSAQVILARGHGELSMPDRRAPANVAPSILTLYGGSVNTPFALSFAISSSWSEGSSALPQ